MKALVLDGYTDEPACLGVPPFISPYARLAYGALSAAGARVRYAIIDQYRAGVLDVSGSDLLVVIRRLAVPGRYLRGMPASDRELLEIAGKARGMKILSLGVGPAKVPEALRRAFDYISCEDLDAGLFDLVETGHWSDRRRSASEWSTWLLRGARACAEHPDHSGPLIAEVQMYRGCVRYITGGCRFCVEPLLGGVEFRQPKDILAEVQELSNVGVRNFRLGAQSCVFCYLSKEVGDTETPKPNVEAISQLLRSISESVRPDVFHLDNANPAVIAAHPRESREVTKAIAEHCTSGNVLAFGLESADPKVGRANNLNSTPEQALEAIKLVNGVGAERGPSGLPLVLPGLNFVCGLEGESKATYDLNLSFLKDVLGRGLLLRRINIRQVIPSRSEFTGVVSKQAFAAFKRKVREEIDGPMLDKLVPDRTILAGVYPEVREGGRTFGRQVGTYPLLVSLPYPVELGKKVDVAVTGRGFRSVTGIVHPTDVNVATMSMLQSVPGIGRKRAMSIVRRRPFGDPGRLWELFDERASLESAQFHLTCGNVVKE